MTITEEIHNNTATLTLEGSFTYTQRKLFQDTLKNLASQNVEHVIVDLAQVPFLDSAALGLLMITHRQLVADKRKLSLAHPQATIRQIIELANLHKTIPLIESAVAPLAKKIA
ncbi:MAG: STAS domain-containing protein [Nitrospira defluvii]|nr:STAS domain-containing protein [Nitrospira defluvii]